MRKKWMKFVDLLNEGGLFQPLSVLLTFWMKVKWCTRKISSGKWRILINFIAKIIYSHLHSSPDFLVFMRAIYINFLALDYDKLDVKNNGKEGRKNKKVCRPTNTIWIFSLSIHNSFMSFSLMPSSTLLWFIQICFRIDYTFVNVLGLFQIVRNKFFLKINPLVSRTTFFIWKIQINKI